MITVKMAGDKNAYVAGTNQHNCDTPPKDCIAVNKKDSSIQDNITSTLLSHFETERKERKKFILYLKMALPITVLLPLLAVVVLVRYELVTGSLEVMVSLTTAILIVPVSIVGVFKVVSEKLFEDKYRTSLLDFLSKNNIK